MPTDQVSTSTQLPPDVQQMLAAAGGAPAADLITAFVATVLRSRGLERGDLKVMHRAVRELRYALSVFARYRDVRKVTVFGSARAHASHPAYGLAKAFAQRMVKAGFMVITGGGGGFIAWGAKGGGGGEKIGLDIPP